MRAQVFLEVLPSDAPVVVYVEVSSGSFSDVAGFQGDFEILPKRDAAGRGGTGRDGAGRVVVVVLVVVVKLSLLVVFKLELLVNINRQ